MGRGIVAVWLVVCLLSGACTPAPRPASQGALSDAATAPAAAVPAAAPTTPREPLAIDVGYLPSLVYSPLYVAYEKGYYRERGLAINLEPGAASPTAQIGSGQLPIAGFGLDAAFFNAVARGIDMRAILPITAVRAGGTSTVPMMVRKELWDSGTVRSVADLRGRRIGRNGTSVGTFLYSIHLALNAHGLTLADVEQVSGLGFPDMLAALAQGGIDAGVISEPFAVFAEERGIAVVLNDRHDQGLQLNALAVNGPFARAHPERIVDFAVAYLRAARDLYGDGRLAPENLAIMEQYTKVPAATIMRTRQPYTDPNGELLLDSMLAMQQFMIANGAVELAEPLPPDQLVDQSVARRAVAILGEFRP